MNNVLLSLTLLLGMALLFTACDSDDDHHHSDDNEINIMILSPMDGEVISMEDASAVEIHVVVEATEENHDVEIELYPVGESANKILDWHLHTHDQLVEFANDPVDLSSFEAGTEFHLEVKACIDHDCDERETKHIHFTIAD